MKIDGRIIMKSFAPIHLKLEIHSSYYQILAENLGFSKRKSNTRKIDIVADQAGNISATEEPHSSIV